MIPDTKSEKEDLYSGFMPGFTKRDFLKGTHNKQSISMPVLIKNRQFNDVDDLQMMIQINGFKQCSYSAID